MLMIVTGLGFGGLQQFSSAETIRVNSFISFMDPVSVSNWSDVRFGGGYLEPNDRIVMDTSGKIKIIGTGVMDDANGLPGSITIEDTSNQGINFLSGNYRYGSGVGALQAICALNSHPGEEKDCARISPIPGAGKKILNIGMGVTVTDIPVSSQSAPSSFDFFVVYQ